MSGLLGEIGSIDWCRRTKGIMSRSERRRFMAALVLHTARTTPPLLLARAGLWKSGPDPASYSAPDTVLARRVLDACAELEPMILEHCFRSYLFARGLAAVEGESLDDEALFAATMLHDLAFPRLDDSDDDRCFALKGAERATHILQQSTLSPEVSEAVLDAITLHINPYVTPDRGALQRIVHDGIMLDVAGVRARELDRHGIDRVLARHPQHGWLQRGPRLFGAHGARVPGSRTAAVGQCAMHLAVRLNPFFAPEARTLNT
jgi:hypothetical protein